MDLDPRIALMLPEERLASIVERRWSVLTRRRDGASIAEVATELGLARRTVRLLDLGGLRALVNDRQCLALALRRMVKMPAVDGRDSR